MQATSNTVKHGAGSWKHSRVKSNPTNILLYVTHTDPCKTEKKKKTEIKIFKKRTGVKTNDWLPAHTASVLI